MRKRKKTRKIKHLLPDHLVRKHISSNKSSNKQLRRNIRRIAERKGITYIQAILHFYNVKSIYELDKNLIYIKFLLK